MYWIPTLFKFTDIVLLSDYIWSSSCCWLRYCCGIQNTRWSYRVLTVMTFVTTNFIVQDVRYSHFRFSFNRQKTCFLFINFCINISIIFFQSSKIDALCILLFSITLHFGILNVFGSTVAMSDPPKMFYFCLKVRSLLSL